MEVFIDKEFAKHYWEIAIDSSIKENLEKEFLRHSSLFTIITNFNSIEEIKKSDEASFFFEILLEFQIADIVFLPQLFEHDYLENCLRSGDFKIFLLDSKHVSNINIEESYGYEVIDSSNLVEKWTKYMIDGNKKKSLSIPVNPDDEDSFNSWNDLAFISQTSNNSILIVDKYILSDKSSSRLTDNLFPLLEQLLPKEYKGELSIVIISEEILSHQRNSLKEKAQKIHQLLNSKFSKYKSIQLKFSIIHHNKAFYSKDTIEIHERYIYTNYYTIHCGKGYDLFNGKKRINSDADITVSFNFNRYQMKTIPLKINSIKHYLNRMEKVETLNAFKHYPEKNNCPILK